MINLTLKEYFLRRVLDRVAKPCLMRPALGVGLKKNLAPDPKSLSTPGLEETKTTIISLSFTIGDNVMIRLFKCASNVTIF